MKYSIFLPFLAGFVAAAPVDTLAPIDSLEARQIISSTQNELTSGACRPVIFIFARGSTEPGNIGSTVGPSTCSRLKSVYGSTNVACQGVGSPYIADLGSNALPQGTTTAAIGEAQRLFNLAYTKCPNSKVVAGGYSQGAAVMVGSIRGLTATVQNQIKGVVLYGNTRNQQEGGKIPNFPPEKVLTICEVLDGVCYGTLIVSAAHLAYADDVPAAVAFLQARITAAGGI